MENLQIVSAPSILGLKPGGVERLPQSLLSQGLLEKTGCKNPVLELHTLNSLYSSDRDKSTDCLNAGALQTFSIHLGDELLILLKEDLFPLILGGDCSILIGVLCALKKMGTFGLLFCDAHADFYQPEKSITGEVADMDLAIVTGRGPEILTNIFQFRPYIRDQHVIHFGQRDWEETRKYGSQDIRTTDITRFDLNLVRQLGIDRVLEKAIEKMDRMHVQGFWIHFDTDVIADEENWAVDYRLPGGLSFNECEKLLKGLLDTRQIVGMSVTIFNPDLDDNEQTISKKLTELLGVLKLQ